MVLSYVACHFRWYNGIPLNNGCENPASISVKKGIKVPLGSGLRSNAVHGMQSDRLIQTVTEGYSSLSEDFIWGID